jgi:hypothetical protein
MERSCLLNWKGNGDSNWTGKKKNIYIYIYTSVFGNFGKAREVIQKSSKCGNAHVLLSCSCESVPSKVGRESKPSAHTFGTAGLFLRVGT